MGKSLHQDITNGRGLNGACVDRAPASISRKLTKQSVFGPTANHMDRPYRSAKNGFEPVYSPPILECQTFETAPYHCTLIARCYLASSGTISRQPTWHITRSQEAHIIRINLSKKSRCNLSSGYHLIV